MYCKFYGFSEEPFSVTPDPSVLYQSPIHREVLASLIYGIRERRGFLCIVGEPGTGKTTLLRSVMRHINESAEIAYIFNTDVTFEQLLNLALVELNLGNPLKPLEKVEAINRLNEFAIQQLANAKNIVLIIDEAQNLDLRTLEKLRLLSNLETSKHKLIQIILSGQPELDRKLDQPELLQLHQRISVRRGLTPLDQKATYEYIQFRLSAAGYAGAPLFSSRAQALIWKYSGGVPRKINVLCDNALLIGYALGKKKIEANAVQEAVHDLHWKPSSKSRFAREAWFSQALGQRSVLYVGSIVLAVVLVAAFFDGLPKVKDFGLNLWSGLASLFPTDKDHTNQPPATHSPEAAMHEQALASASKSWSDGNSGPMSVLSPGQTEPRGDLQAGGVDLETKRSSSSQAVLAEAGETAALARQRDAYGDGRLDDRRPSVSDGNSEELESDPPIGGVAQDGLVHLEDLISQLGGKAAKPDRNAFVTVKKGDTLSRILTEFYGRYNNALLDAVLRENPSLDNFNRIQIGQVIKLPKDLLDQEQETMPPLDSEGT